MKTLKRYTERLRTNKILKSLIKPFPRYGRAINAVVLLAFVMLVVAGAAALTVHNKPTHITTSPTNTTSSNNCLLSSSGCSDTQKSSTSTQPAQTPAPSTPATTTSPQSSTDSSTSGCTAKTLPPPATTYEDTDALPQGQTEQVTEGSNGMQFVCNGVPGAVIQGAAPVVWVGTGITSGSSTGTSSNNGGLTEAQAAQQCDENLANGADSSDPQAYLDQCMHQYGY